MQEHVYVEENINTILKYMNETANYRHHDIINNKLCITSILQKYPRFMDCTDGNLVST